MRLIPYVRKTEAPARIWPEFPSFFEEFFNDSFFFPLTRNGDRWVPAVDVLEKDGNLVLRAEIPGVSEKDIELKLENNVLTLKGEKKSEQEENGKSYHRKESYYGSFSRSFTLPETADRDNIKADFKKGVLEITIPQKAEAKPRAIQVSVN
jgi:HSP20 family protein